MFVLFSQLGRCRPVSDFEKLNRIGEGTYGIVCEFIFSYVNKNAIEKNYLHTSSFQGVL